MSNSGGGDESDSNSDPVESPAPAAGAKVKPITIDPKLIDGDHLTHGMTPEGLERRSGETRPRCAGPGNLPQLADEAEG
jgi:hypothetical protein